MLNLTEAKTLEINEDNYDRLMAVIEASLGMLALLIVSCEQRAFREEIIERYETELSPQISCYRVQLDQQEPSLRAALAALVEQNAGLDQAQMVVTVMGISELIDIRLKETEEKSPLERFFGYLQWTREGLRAFPFPIILWVTPAILKRMSLAAPDFWSWRTGVFRFVATEMVEVAALDLQPAFENREVETNQTLPIAELEKQISQIQEQDIITALATLYDRLGQAYSEQIRSGNSKNLQVDIDQAVASFQQATELQRELNFKSDLGNTLIRIGRLYDNLSQYQQAEKFYQQALEITREIGDHQQEATAINGLGNVYQALGEYQRAITFYQQSLDFRREIEDKRGEVSCLGNLGLVYQALGEYQKALTFLQQSLDIVKEIGDKPGEANSLNNLGIVYHSLGEYQKAITFYQQSLDMAREIGYKRGEASSLSNLGNAYQSLGEYQRAITFLQQSLDISREIGDKDGEARLLFGLGLTLTNINQNNDALKAFRNARQLFQETGLNKEAQLCDNLINSLMD
jgi:tetratricopeptide (TPR) repeat protein